VCASSSWSRHLTDLEQTLKERQTLLFLHETDLEVREVILAEELECGVHPTYKYGFAQSK
jgi:hypothetical protein